MQLSRYTALLVVLILVSGLCLSCGSSGDGSTSGADTSSMERVTIRGSVAESMAGIQPENSDTMMARILDMLTFVHNAYAQQQVLEGIFVEVFEGEIKVGEDVTDASGEFVINDVPCNTPLTLVFSFEGNTVTLDGLSVPCPEMGDTGVISMIVSLNFQQGEGEVNQIENEDDLQNAAFSCEGNEDVILGNPEEEFILDGEGFACIITTGDCDLEIAAPSVILENCSKCIDARGNSSVNIETNLFECFSDSDGIMTTGNSAVDATIIGSLAELFVSSGEDGIDSRGNSSVDVDGDIDDLDDSDSIVTIAGFTTGINAVGNSEVEVDAGFCDITPNIVETGNSEVEIDCEEDNLE